MSVSTFEELRAHIGHKIVCVSYGADTDQDPFNVALECDDCGCVLTSYNNPDYDEEPEG